MPAFDRGVMMHRKNRPEQKKTLRDWDILQAVTRLDDESKMKDLSAAWPLEIQQHHTAETNDHSPVLSCFFELWFLSLEF